MANRWARRAAGATAALLVAGFAIVGNAAPAAAGVATTACNINADSTRTVHATGSEANLAAGTYLVRVNIKFGTQVITALRAYDSVKAGGTIRWWTTTIVPGSSGTVVEHLVRNSHLVRSSSMSWGNCTPLATITSVSPSSGSHAGGTRVTIRGAHLSHARAVVFGGVRGTNLVIVSSTELRVTAPAHAAGIVHVRVLDSAEYSVRVPADRFTYT